MLIGFKRVVSNKGSAGIDGMETEALRSYLNEGWSLIKAEILEGSYRPKAVKGVLIPKPDGGQRQLGIPTVLDRLIQQAIAQELSLLYDRGFSPQSYGFRPGRSAHQAVEQARSYLVEGKRYIVEMDLEKFFDRVNHDILLNLLSKRVEG